MIGSILFTGPGPENGSCPICQNQGAYQVVLWVDGCFTGYALVSPWLLLDINKLPNLADFLLRFAVNRMTTSDNPDCQSFLLRFGAF